MRDSGVSIKIIIDKAMRHPLLLSIEYEQVVDYAIDFMRIVGVPQMFSEKMCNIKIENYRGVLPDDLLEIILVKNDYNSICVRESTDTFYQRPDNRITDDIYNITFKVQGKVLMSSIKDALFTISYRGFDLDEDGIPLIPDNSNFSRAMISYIKKEVFGILFDLGKISDKSLNVAQTEYAWNVGSLETDMLKMNLSNAESFFNSVGGLLIKKYQFEQGFRDLGEKERLRFT